VSRWQPYAEYKDSGVEWLGEIPRHWETASFKYMLRLGYGDSLPADSREEGDFLVFGSNGPVGTHSAPNTLAPAIIVGRKGSYGKVNFSEKSVFAIDTTYYTDSRSTKADLRWLFYVLPLLRLDSFSQDSAVPGLSREFAYQHRLPAIPLPEQRAIAAFLDRETARIDALTRKQEQLIALLQEKRAALISHAVTKGLDPDVEMKDSGAEWLGEVPKHWFGTALKRLVAVKITDGPHETPEFVDEGVPFASAEAVYDGRINFDSKRGYISSILHAQYIKKVHPQRDDVFMVKSGATTGKLAMVDVDFEFSVWSPLALIRADLEKATPRFLFLALHADYVQNQVQRTWSAGTQPNISMAAIERLYTVVPPLAEQRAITAHLDLETAKFDALIAKAQEMIERLQEYRTALISAAITGKIDVRGEV
jgi:type I restriction enzyme S subunit